MLNPCIHPLLDVYSTYPSLDVYSMYPLSYCLFHLPLFHVSLPCIFSIDVYSIHSSFNEYSVGFFMFIYTYPLSWCLFHVPFLLLIPYHLFLTVYSMYPPLSECVCVCVCVRACVHACVCACVCVCVCVCA